MPKSNWRIFLSYRSQSEGEDFSRQFYQYLTGIPFHENMYGEVYFSPETARAGDSFNYDIPVVMKNVEYFVMPLTEDYFSDFWDEKNNCPNQRSITYKEIVAAIAVKSRFVCIKFPGFKLDEDLLKKLFGNDAGKISCSISFNYEKEREEALMREIGDDMVRSDYDVSGMAKLIKSASPNVCLSFKRDTENPILFPFYQRMYDVRRITLLNYASCSFITGIDIASIYQETDYLKRWFSYHLSTGKIEADIILTDPYCSAAQDAVTFKMYPVGLNMKKDEIILHSINRLFQFMIKYPYAKLNVYLTKIALPYSVIMAQHVHSTNNHIKVDLYSAVTNDDGQRPSFYLLQNNRETSTLYTFFESNVRSIMYEYAFPFNRHPDISWLLHKHIIHRAVIKSDLLPHTKRAYEMCMKENYPIEVDLLCMKDETIVVGRDDQKISQYGFDLPLSELEVSELRRLNRKAGQDKILTLEELLELINGKIPVLLEIKTKEKTETPEIKRYVQRIVKILQKYSKRVSPYFSAKYNSYGHGFAIHSANPYVLRIIKEMDCLIPCGVISMDFSNLRNEVGDEFCHLHNNASFVDILTPDFISYNIKHIHNGIAKRVCEKNHIPLLGWTVHDEEEQITANDYKCDNIIIEGRKSYM